MLLRSLTFAISVAAGMALGAASAGALIALAAGAKCCRRDTSGNVLRPKEPPTSTSADAAGTAT